MRYFLMSLLWGSLAVANAATLSDLPASGYSDAVSATPTSSGTVRSYSWAMPRGSLIPNWSFENDLEFWQAKDGAQLRVSGGHSGKYAVRLVEAAGDNLVGIQGEPITLKAGQSYVLSFFYNGSPSGATIYPSISFVDLNGNVLGTRDGTSYVSSSAWMQYSMNVPAHAQDCRAVITLANGPRPTGVSLVFDDVLFTEGDRALPSDRDEIIEAGGITDPMGIAYHLFSKSGADTTYRIDAKGYDNFWRPDSTYLPYFAVDPTTLPANRLTLATASNAVRGAGNAPFSLTIYADALGAGYPKTASTHSGDAWTTATHQSRSGWLFVDALPSSASDLPSDLESWAESVTSGEKPYRADWACDPDGNYAVKWTDALGNVRLSARLLDRQNQASASSWKWAFTQYVYYPDGHLRYTVTPLEYGTGKNSLSTITSYDQAGRVIAVVSPDEGRIRYWYNQVGHLRYRQKASQRSKSQYTYWTYDAQGRTIAEGEVTATNVDPQTLANTVGSESQYSPIERKGWIYDDIARWDERNLPSRTTVLGTTTFAGQNGTGKLVAQYHRNPHITSPLAGDTSVAARLVADFYSYDSLGRQKIIGRYVGAAADSLQRQSVEYRYDTAWRISQILVDHSMDQTLQPDESRNTDMWYAYTYDNKGRMQQIDDLHSKNDQLLATYDYDSLGHVIHVGLGRNGGSNIPIPSAVVSYGYHLHGQVNGISAINSSGKVLYRQALGYETPVVDPATSGVSVTSSYSGRLTQDVRQFGTNQNIIDQNNPGAQTVLAHAYDYDAGGRLLQNRASMPSSKVAYIGTRGDANFSVSYSATAALSESFSYDDNDRLNTRQYGNQSSAAQYAYSSGTNLLDHVNGEIKPNVTRDASASGTFRYDADGNLINDASKLKWMSYDADGQVTQIGSRTPGSLTFGGSYLFPLYDADGQMAVVEKAISYPNAYGNVGRVQYVRIGGKVQKEIRETWSYYDSADQHVSKTLEEITNVIGQSSVIGRRLHDGNLNFYLKDHQGSTIRVIDSTGSIVSSYDYQAYGDPRTLEGESPDVTEKWTGKQFFDGSGLYYFGARWYDPELGMWTAPDPAHQFASPYAYGTSPLITVDADGRDDGFVIPPINITIPPITIPPIPPVNVTIPPIVMPSQFTQYSDYGASDWNSNFQSKMDDFSRSAQSMAASQYANFQSSFQSSMPSYNSNTDVNPKYEKNSIDRLSDIYPDYSSSFDITPNSEENSIDRLSDIYSHAADQQQKQIQLLQQSPLGMFWNPYPNGILASDENSNVIDGSSMIGDASGGTRGHSSSRWGNVGPDVLGSITNGASPVTSMANGAFGMIQDHPVASMMVAGAPLLAAFAPEIVGAVGVAAYSGTLETAGLYATDAVVTWQGLDGSIGPTQLGAIIGTIMNYVQSGW